MNKILSYLSLCLSLFVSVSLFAQENFTPLPGDGTTEEGWCDIASPEDLDADGNMIPETLRHRIELYNSGDRCEFYMFFLFRDKTIRLDAPLVLERNLHDRDPNGSGRVLTGTYLRGTGPGGEEDSLKIVLDGSEVTKDPNQCVFNIVGGFEARQQIHGLTIIAQTARQAICDEEGRDLMTAISPNPNCEGEVGAQCEFKNVTVLKVEKPPTVTQSPRNPISIDIRKINWRDVGRNYTNRIISEWVQNCYPGLVTDRVDTDGDGTIDYCDKNDDGDGIDDEDDLCPLEEGSAPNAGCPETMCVDLVARVAKVKTGIDEDRDGLDQACDPEDKPIVVVVDPDLDDDGICDVATDGTDPVTNNPCEAGPDNCRLTANTDQIDTDEDGDGDACDPDQDADGLLNEDDNCPLIANEDQEDADENNIGDACDPDFAETPEPEKKPLQGFGCRVVPGNDSGKGSNLLPLAMLLGVYLIRGFRKRIS